MSRTWKKLICIRLPVTVGVGKPIKYTLGRCGTQNQMAELATGGGQPATGLLEAPGLCKVTKDQSDKLMPVGKCCRHDAPPRIGEPTHKRMCRHDLEDLPEQTRSKLHGRDCLEVFGDSLSLSLILLRRVSSSQFSLKTYFGQE